MAQNKRKAASVECEMKAERCWTSYLHNNTEPSLGNCVPLRFLVSCQCSSHANYLGQLVQPDAKNRNRIHSIIGRLNQRLNNDEGGSNNWCINEVNGFLMNIRLKGQHSCLRWTQPFVKSPVETLNDVIKTKLPFKRFIEHASSQELMEERELIHQWIQRDPSLAIEIDKRVKELDMEEAFRTGVRSDLQFFRDCFHSNESELGEATISHPFKKGQVLCGDVKIYTIKPTVKEVSCGTESFIVKRVVKNDSDYLVMKFFQVINMFLPDIIEVDGETYPPEMFTYGILKIDDELVVKEKVDGVTLDTWIANDYEPKPRDMKKLLVSLAVSGVARIFLTIQDRHTRNVVIHLLGSHWVNLDNKHFMLNYEKGWVTSHGVGLTTFISGSELLDRRHLELVQTVSQSLMIYLRECWLDEITHGADILFYFPEKNVPEIIRNQAQKTEELRKSFETAFYNDIKHYTQKAKKYLKI